MQLVIGYGNALRRDDGVALAVVDVIAARGLAGVQVERLHELVPELAEPLAAARRVVFVDAAVDAAGVVVQRLEGAAGGSPLSHFADPRALLALADMAYGARPEAFLVTIAAAELGIGEGLSPATAALVDEAVAAVLGLLSVG